MYNFSYDLFITIWYFSVFLLFCGKNEWQEFNYSIIVNEKDSAHFLLSPKQNAKTRWQNPFSSTQFPKTTFINDFLLFSALKQISNCIVRMFILYCITQKLDEISLTKFWLQLESMKALFRRSSCKSDELFVGFHHERRVFQTLIGSYVSFDSKSKFLSQIVPFNISEALLIINRCYLGKKIYFFIKLFSYPQVRVRYQVQST